MVSVRSWLDKDGMFRDISPTKKCLVTSYKHRYWIIKSVYLTCPIFHEFLRFPLFFVSIPIYLGNSNNISKNDLLRPIYYQKPPSMWMIRANLLLEIVCSDSKNKGRRGKPRVIGEPNTHSSLRPESKIIIVLNK